MTSGNIQLDLKQEFTISLSLKDLIELYDFSKEYTFEPLKTLRKRILPILDKEIIGQLADGISTERHD